ncbi:hypothetical protein LIER_31983 [Lithospermum erythrorhizon]|uniref:Uncharacterized protein n=1 Tax=Lithospermum erythrorhizon TaxID=34254 RepID=A0AAV3RVR3_LITER
MTQVHGGWWIFTVITKLSTILWELLRFINNNSSLPITSLGYFTEVLDVTEHSSCRRQRPMWQINMFKKIVIKCELMDIGFVGYPFTWCNNFISLFSSRARLDRCLVSKSWKILFLVVKVTHLSSNHSDHMGLLVDWGVQKKLQGKKKQFRFEDGWCLHKESKDFVVKSWNLVKVNDPDRQVFESVKQCCLGLLDWKRVVLAHFHKNLKDKQRRLKILQQGTITNGSKKKSVIIAKEIDRLREVNDVYFHSVTVQ